MPGLLGLRKSAGNINHGKQAEYICLNKTGEKVEVAGKNCGETVGKNGNPCQNAGCLEKAKEAENSRNDTENQSDFLSALLPKDYKDNTYGKQYGSNDPAAGRDEVDNCGGSDGKSGVYKSSDNAAARYVAEMTECHGNGLGDFGNDIHGGHYYYGLGESFEPAENAFVFDFVIPYYEGNHYCPHHYAADVGGSGAKETGQSDVGAENRGEEDGADKRCPVGIVFAHGVGYHFAQHHNAFFDHDLPSTGSFFQIFSADDAGNADDESNNEGG